MRDQLAVAKAEDFLGLLPSMANRHGLITGATGTGKTVTLRVMAEAFSELGVPVVMSDVKGDLSGLAMGGDSDEKIRQRVHELGVDGFSFRGFPVVFWDLYGERGHPIRTTVSEMGPLLLSRVLNLNDTQSGVLNLAFRVADDHGLLLLDLKDLRAIVQYVGDHAAELKTEYGNVSSASIGAIQRNLLALESQDGERFFGEPALELDDLIQTAQDGSGCINIIAADRLIQAPTLYATFLLWLLAELFDRLPEVGDVSKPKLVFFFDEAHLLFDDAPDALMDKIEQVVRLIRSKGVGVYFVTQNPIDIPDRVLGQLGNRVQHALRAFTPKDQKAIRAAAETFRINPQLDVVSAIAELGVGEALVSFLDQRGQPAVVERARVLPPRSRLKPLSDEERGVLLRQSTLAGTYDTAVDRESAYEILRSRAADEAAAPAPEKRSGAARRTDTVLEAFAKTAARSMAKSISNQLVRGVLGSWLGTTSRKRR
ncbi:MAG: DUF853 family protein [Gammaproteobacteria bacterium]|nr:DUF853 family protein [Gammaproteobacteria bacterium]